MFKLYKKKIFSATFVFMLMCGSQALAQQLPQVNYQGVARKADGNPVTEQAISIKLTIHDGSATGSSVYSETRRTTTNKFGLFNLVIGSAGTTAQTGTMSSINWSTGNKFLQVEIDPAGGSSFIDMGTSQLQSVPYAIYASSAAPGGAAGGDLGGTFPNPVVSKIQGSPVSSALPVNGQVLKWNGSAWAPSEVSAAMAQANATTDGFLSKEDWLIFNGKATVNYVDAAIAAENTRATAAEALKENSANKSAATTLGTSDVLFPTQNAVKTYVDASSATGNTAIAAEVTRATAAEGTLNTAITAENTRATAAEGVLTTALAAEVTRATTAEALKENAANKSAVTTLGTSDVLFPTQNAVKTYVDASSATTNTAIAAEVTRATAAEALKENAANKSAATTLGTSDVLFPTQNAVKTYVDASSATTNTAITAEVTRATAAEGVLTTALAAEVTRATAAEGVLTTALAAEVTRATAAEALKENAANKSTATTLGTSDVLFPTQNAVKSYVDGRVAGALPSFNNGAVLFGNGTGIGQDAANLFWDNTNKRLGIMNSSPAATFQIGPKDNFDAESLSWGKMADMNTLQLGYRQTNWKFKAGNNSGVITSLIIANNSGGQDVPRMIFNQEGNTTQILDPLFASTSITSPLANLSSLNLNNGAMTYNSATPGVINLLTSTPENGSFKIGENQANLRYEYSGFGATSALSLGFRQYSMAFRLLTNSGVGYGMTLNHNNGTTDKPLITFLQDGTITAYDKMTAGSFVKQGGTSSQYLMADGSVSTMDAANGTGASGQMTYWTAAKEQSGATNLLWNNTDNFLKVGAGASIENFDYQNPAMPTTPAVLNLFGGPAAANTQIMLRMKRNHNQGTAYAALADFVMVGGPGNAMRLDLNLGHQSNNSVFNAMSFTNSGKVGVGNTNPQAEFDVTGAGKFSTDVTAQSFIKTGGTSSQFLMADGSVSSYGGPLGGGANGQVNYWTDSRTQAGSPNFLWDNDNKILKFGPGVVSIDNDLYPNQTLSATPVTTIYGSPASPTAQTLLRLRRGHNQGNSYGFWADFVTSGTNNALQLDLKISNVNNTAAYNAMTFTNSGRVGVMNSTPQTEFDVTGAGQFSGSVTANTFVKTGGLATEILTANGTVLTAGTNITISNGTISATAAAPAAAVREVADEFAATAAQTSFTLSQEPSANSKVKMYVNGIRISNTAYSVVGTTLTYNPANNGAYALSAGDRIQFDFYY